MVLIKPQLRIIENHKLYLSRRPGFIVWLLFGITVIIFIEVCCYFTDNIFILAILLLGSIIFGLDIVGNWEDVMLDRNQNIAIVTKYVWNEKLILKNLEKSMVMNLSDIRHVGASQETGLFFLSKSGRTITFNTSGMTQSEVRNMKKEIVSFLEVNRINISGPYTTSSYHEKYSSASENENEHQLPQKYGSFINDFTTSYPKVRRSNERMSAMSSIHKRLSTPVVGINEIDKTNIKQQFRNYKNRT